jgi:hypothetical protein
MVRDSSSAKLDLSPEQACGKPVDKPANIRSFGIVLYERLPGVFGRDETVHRHTRPCSE